MIFVQKVPPNHVNSFFLERAILSESETSLSALQINLSRTTLSTLSFESIKNVQKQEKVTKLRNDAQNMNKI